MTNTASPPISDIRFRNQKGEPLIQPIEWEPATIELPIPAGDWQRYRLTIQGQNIPLRVESRDGVPVVCASWNRSGTGNYRIALACDKGPIENRTIQLAPQKISTTQFAELVSQLETELPARVAYGLDVAGANIGIEHLALGSEPIFESEVAQLKRALVGTGSDRAGLLDTLKHIAPDPHKMLLSEEVWTTCERVRRPAILSIQRSVARPGNLEKIGLSVRPLRVLDTRARHTFDVPENRALALFVSQIKHRLHRAIRYAEANTKSCQAIAHELVDLRTSFDRRLHECTFMRNVPLPAAPPLNPTMVQMMRPDYRAAYVGWLEFNRTQNIRLDHPGIDNPLTNLPQLYEVWGTLVLINAFVGEASKLDLKVKSQNVVRRWGNDIFVKVLKGGELAIEMEDAAKDRRLSIIPQRSFGRTSNYRSISFSQKPDIVIKMERSGSSPRLYIFDPKYKLVSESLPADAMEGDENEKVPKEAPKKIDIDKMHAYRDAIRDADDNHVIQLAAILYPGTETIDYKGDVAAISALPGNDQTLHDTLRSIAAQILAGDAIKVPTTSHEDVTVRLEAS